MNFHRVVHPLADAELIEVARWYEGEKSGLGEDFLVAAETTVRMTLDWPHIAPVFPGWDREPVVRSKSVKGFPFRILYYFTNDTLWIIAFAHNRREPGYWKNRV